MKRGSNRKEEVHFGTDNNTLYLSVYRTTHTYIYIRFSQRVSSTLQQSEFRQGVNAVKILLNKLMTSKASRGSAHSSTQDKPSVREGSHPFTTPTETEGGAPPVVKSTTVTKHPKNDAAEPAPHPPSPPIPGAVVKVKKTASSPSPSPPAAAPVSETTVTKLPKSSSNPTRISISTSMSLERLRALRQYGSTPFASGCAADGTPSCSPEAAVPASECDAAVREEEETRDLISDILLRYCRGSEASSSSQSSKRKGGGGGDGKSSARGSKGEAAAENTAASGGGTQKTQECDTPPAPEEPSATPEMVLFDELVHLCTTRDVTPHLLELVRELLSRTRVIPHYSSGGSAQQQALTEEAKRREYAQQLIMILLNQMKEKKLKERMGIQTNISTAALVKHVQEALHASNRPQATAEASKKAINALPSAAPPGPISIPVHTTSACTRTTVFGAQQFVAPTSTPPPVASPFVNANNPFSYFSPSLSAFSGTPTPVPQPWHPTSRVPKAGLPFAPPSLDRRFAPPTTWWDPQATAAAGRPNNGGNNISVGSFGNLFASPEMSRRPFPPSPVFSEEKNPPPHVNPYTQEAKEVESDEDMMEDLRTFMRAATSQEDLEGEERKMTAACAQMVKANNSQDGEITEATGAAVVDPGNVDAENERTPAKDALSVAAEKEQRASGILDATPEAVMMRTPSTAIDFNTSLLHAELSSSPIGNRMSSLDFFFIAEDESRDEGNSPPPRSESRESTSLDNTNNNSNNHGDDNKAKWNIFAEDFTPPVQSEGSAAAPLSVLGHRDVNEQHNDGEGEKSAAAPSQRRRVGFSEAIVVTRRAASVPVKEE